MKRVVEVGEVNKRNICLAMCITITAILFAVMLIHYNVASIAPMENRPLAKIFLENTFNTLKNYLWAGSPEVVTSILWDYRGIDTIYETVVFFLAIIGSVALVRTLKLTSNIKGEGLTVIAKTVTKIIFATIPIVAFSIAIHGHLTPGGGFQGGSAFAVAPLLVIAAFSLRFLVQRGWDKEKLLVLRTTGLLLIGLIAVIALLTAVAKGIIGYVMQNQPKPWAPTGFPVTINFLGSQVLISGTLLWLNISEFLAVGAGLSLVFVLLTTHTSLLHEEVGKK